MEGGRYAGLPPDEAKAKELEALMADLECGYRARILLFAARRLGSLEAEDVAQETLRRVFEALQAGRIANISALPAFLFQTARHICMHRARSARREGNALRRFARTPDHALDDPLASLISGERQTHLKEAIAKLAEDDREILTLSYAEALRTPEIARRLNLSPGNVRVRRHRALKRLAELLDVTQGSGREP